jgi:von Willebrand factor type A domain
VSTEKPSLRSRLRPRGVAVHDSRSFVGAIWRARILQLVFAGAAVALVFAAISSARELESSAPGLIPNDSTGVVVVDLSLSIEDEDYRAVRTAFKRLIADNASIGLVVFSDVPYELLPPGTPAAELRPMLRLLVPPRLGPPVNPWSITFRAGTHVSSALRMARDMLRRDGIEKGSILLVSDLETAPDDVPSLSRIVEEIRRSPIELRAYALAPSSDARLIFGGLLQTGAFTLAPGSSEEAEPVEAAIPVPRSLLILGALLFAALAAYERFASRLMLTRGTESVP